MIPSAIIGGITCLTIILSVFLFPQIRVGKLRVDTYWIIALLGALSIILFGLIDLKYLLGKLTESSPVNPLKILILFISMTVLSIFLDEAGFFRYLASRTLIMAKKSQFRLFTALYLTVSVLTVFTSNDIIVLTFTPFICYFSKNAKLNPVPYLVSEFIAANTMSMALIVGNPTNIYIATSYNITFTDYFSVMFLPTLASSVVAFFVLLLLFSRQLKKTSEVTSEAVKIENKPLLIMGFIHLAACTVILVFSSYIGIEMWIVSFFAAVSLFISAGIYYILKKKKPEELIMCVKRAPWQLIPFVLSMFIIILSLSAHGFTDMLSGLLGTENTVFKYGITSFLSANLINNIPMSVLFCPIISPLSGIEQIRAVYATIIGSNIGAYLTPIGALAGIMWASMLKKCEVKFSYVDFIKYGAAVSVPTLFSALFVLQLLV